MRSGHARPEITVHIEETILVSATFVFVIRVQLGNCVHSLISLYLHFFVFGIEAISSDKRSIDICTHFNYFILLNIDDMRVCENCIDPNL